MSRGGYRENSGRNEVPAEDKKENWNCRVSKWVQDALCKKHPTERKGNLTEHALIKTYGLEKKSGNI